MVGETMIAIYWLLDTSDPQHPQGRPFYVGKASDPRARLHKLLTDAWRCMRPLDARIHAIGVRNVRMHIVAELPDDGPWHDKLARSIAMVRYCWPNGNCNGLPAASVKPTPSKRKRAPRLSLDVANSRRRRRFRYHRRDKRPEPGDASAPRGSFRTDGSADWR